ncbi:glycosyl hydrolase family 28 protein [Bifidobacterium vespertilionis]|uniref:glycosyl hydrolase family 28 protein n=1 Tax=Bifidobacterium vespertilionis TaxID=2562524 RepID=UPI001BDD9EB6|nr:glycosyl hydrolase family 28 protein [Bifidobacterium vespertilionis]MBT1180011.1 right-handed parallel beta-helix repeat-containing protein [Bifidobacterium vespertilionis]
MPNPDRSDLSFAYLEPFIMIKTYPAPFGANLRDEFTVRVRPASGGEWQQLDTYRVKVDMHDVREASMAYFDMDEPVEVEVTVNRFYYIYTAAIRPLSYRIEPVIEPRRLTFRLDKPANLSIELNKERFHNLHLFAGPVENEEAIRAAADVVIEPDRVPGRIGTFDPNAALEALDPDKVSGPKRRIFVEAGCYGVAETVWHIPSHVDVYLAGGVVLQGALSISRAQDVTIHGRGVLDMAFLAKQTGIGGIRIDGCRDVTIDGITLINPPHYSVCGGMSRRITIRNLKTFSCEGWSDGIDMMSCSNVLVEGCFLRNSDDCVALYGSRWNWRGGTSNVIVRNTTLWADVAHPINIGTHGDHEHDGDVIENILFDHIDVLEHHEFQPGYLGVMAINPGDKNTVRRVTFRNFNIEPFEHGRVLDLEVKFNPTYNPAPGRLISDILLENINVTTGDGEEPSIIAGYDDIHPVESVRIVNMVRDGRVCATLEDANIELRDYARGVRIGAGSDAEAGADVPHGAALAAAPVPKPRP